MCMFNVTNCLAVQKNVHEYLLFDFPCCFSSCIYCPVWRSHITTHRTVYVVLCTHCSAWCVVWAAGRTSGLL